ncbi:MAG: HlyD family efflux transporter periplasmic adaptor subunit [Desulfovibrio sp.]|jgi:membrane fusion protein (multidrug efflux system)|nr:HlyD family efflux transporter periplasmic adaptor subunit [Desulfovibrio sp.]
MAETARLELSSPSPENSGRPFRRPLLAALFVGIFALSALAGWWLAGGRIRSVSAVLDARLSPVVPEFSARLEEITVREGDRVSARQAVGRVDASGYARQLREAGRDAAALRPSLMEETAERLKVLQEAERSIVVRLAQSRNEEEARRRIREDRVMEHARAQLALRSLDSQGGEKVVGKARYQEARLAEEQTRLKMEIAREDFEQFSRMRAVADQELRRIREEGLKTGGIEGGIHQVPADTVGTLYAPVSGTVLHASAAPGQMVKRGQPVLLILPDGEGAESAFRLVAYFPLEVKDNLGAGQPCDVRFDGEADAVQGEVEELMPPQTLPGDALTGTTAAQAPDAASFGMQLFVPVRIRLKDQPKSALRSGRYASCVVRTRGIFGFRGF